MTPGAVMELAFKTGVHGWCPTCKQKIRKLNPHRMCASKLRLLRDIHAIEKSSEWWVKVNGDCTLESCTGEKTRTVNDASVKVQRLRYFKLVERANRRGGLYRLTGMGLAFLGGRLKIPTKIWCRDGEVVEVDTGLVSLSEAERIIFGAGHWDEYSELQRHG